MFAQQLNILHRSRQQMRDLASLQDFTWEAGNTVDAHSLIDNPTISLYCFDDDSQQAIFASLPESIDLSQVTFVYQSQFDNAEYLIAVPYTIFLQLAQNFDVDDRQLICIHSVGRCGSTLMTQALNELDSTIAFSESDIFSNFVTIRHTSRDEQILLLQASFKFMFRPTVVGDNKRYVLKFRNHCSDIMDIFFEAFPNAKHLFMYRNAMDWVSSLYRIIYNTGRSHLQLSYDEAVEQHQLYFNLPIEEVTPLFDSSQGTFSITLCRAVLWVQMMNRYAEFYERGLRPIVIRYEDLIEHRDDMLLKLFDVLDLPQDALRKAQSAFERDSQAGTKMARDKAQSGNTINLPIVEVEAVKKLLNQQPIVNQSDYILQGTISIT